MGSNGYGWVEVKDGHIISHTRDDDGNDIEHRFENELLMKSYLCYRIVEKCLEVDDDSPADRNLKRVMGALIENTDKLFKPISDRWNAN